jgi:hypothetical protein
MRSRVAYGEPSETITGQERVAGIQRGGWIGRPAKADFREPPRGEVRITPLPRTPMDRGNEGRAGVYARERRGSGIVPEGRTAPVRWAGAPRVRRALTRSGRACASSPACAAPGA